MFRKKISLIPAYKIFDKEDQFQVYVLYILTTSNHFRNYNTDLPLNSDDVKPLIQQPPYRPLFIY